MREPRTSTAGSGFSSAVGAPPAARAASTRTTSGGPGTTAPTGTRHTPTRTGRGSTTTPRCGSATSHPTSRSSPAGCTSRGVVFPGGRRGWWRPALDRVRAGTDRRRAAVTNAPHPADTAEATPPRPNTADEPRGSAHPVGWRRTGSRTREGAMAQEVVVDLIDDRTTPDPPPVKGETSTSLSTASPTPSSSAARRQSIPHIARNHTTRTGRAPPPPPPHHLLARPHPADVEQAYPRREPAPRPQPRARTLRQPASEISCGRAWSTGRWTQLDLSDPVVPAAFQGLAVPPWTAAYGNRPEASLDDSMTGRATRGTRGMTSTRDTRCKS